MRLVLGLTLLFVALDTGAVRLGPRGTGQVLLYPYYTIRATPGGVYNTLFSVTNTAPDTKVVRVRFHESRNGREVAGVNVFLVPFDSWVGAIVPDAAAPEFLTNDSSCTDPVLGYNPGRLAFGNAQYSGANADGEDPSLDRVFEGYIEVYEMGVVVDQALLAALAPYRGDDMPGTANCNAARAIPIVPASMLAPPTGGLMGSAAIISVGDGTLYSYDATALDDFSRTPIWTPATDMAHPSLADVNPKMSELLDVGGYRVSSWDPAKGASPADPVSAVLMQNHLLNTYVLDVETNSATDWIVTMPTKPFYVPVAASGAAAATPPFESTFGKGGASDYFGLAPTTLDYDALDFGDTQVYDREGVFPVEQIGLGPNPPPALIELPWVANVVSFNATNLFASPVRAYVGALAPSGWLRLAPYQYPNSSVHKLLSTDSPPHVYYGLPMIGFMANDYVNGALPGASGPVLSNYGATSPHKGSIRIE
jgi:hypothetical protein